jgi:hypothetical protein
MVVDHHLEACRELVAKLAGLPLALVVAGAMIARSLNRGHAVADMIRELRSRTDKLLQEPVPADVQQFLQDVDNPNVVALLQMSTDELDEESRLCFAGTGLVTPSEDATFDLEYLAAGWQSVLGERSTRRAQIIVDNLIDNGLMQAVEYVSGSRRYYMHDLLIQHAKTMFDEE